MAHQPGGRKDLPRNLSGVVTLSIAAVAAVAAVLTLVDPWASGIGVFHGQVDLDVYREGASRAYRGIPLYETPMFYGHLYTYPPFSALIFMTVRCVPGLVYSRSPYGASVDYAWLGCTLVLLLVCVLLCWRLLGYRINARLVGVSVALTLVCCFLEPVRDTLFFGQINIALMLLVLWDCSYRGRFRGAAIGLAAGMKLTPLYFVGYLVMLRQWRAAAVAVGTFAATVGWAWLLLPRDSLDFWTQMIFRAERVGPLRHAGNQSLQGMVAHLTGHPMPSWLWLLAAGPLVLASLLLARRLHEQGQPLLAVTVCGLSSSVVSPFAWFHHWVWFVPLLVYLVHRAWSSPRWWLAAAALLAVAGSWVYWYKTFPVVGIYMLPPWWLTAPLHENIYVLAFAVIFGWLALGQRQSVRGQPALRINVLASDENLEVEMRPGGVPAVAHAGDLHSGGHPLTNGHKEVVHVPVHGDGAVVVADAHPQPEPGGRASVDDGAVRDRIDRGADGAGDVDPGVEGAPARAKT